jgi:CRP-like cAMP-binding protein
MESCKDRIYKTLSSTKRPLIEHEIVVEYERITGTWIGYSESNLSRRLREMKKTGYIHPLTGKKIDISNRPRNDKNYFEWYIDNRELF